MKLADGESAPWYYGLRKWSLGILYLVLVAALGLASIVTGGKAGDLAGVAALGVSMATGLGVIIWGNVQSARTGADASKL